MNDQFSAHFEVVEESNVTASDAQAQPSKRPWDKFATWAIYALVGIIPLWFLPFTILPLDLNKAYLAYALILLSFIFWLIGRVEEGKVRIPKNPLLLALVSLVGVAFVSALFSVSKHVSFIGLGYEEGTVTALLLFVLAALGP